jgi:uncharacterized protein (DUF1778 family)
MGRPKKEPGDLKKSTLSIRLTPEERAEIEEAAEIDWMTASDWARRTLLAAARAGRSAL